MDRKLLLLHLGEESRILHGVVERLADDRQMIRRHLLRHDERPADFVAAVEEIEQLLLLVALGKAADIDGALRDFIDALAGETDEGMDLAILDPFEWNAAVGAAIAVELAPLDGQALLGAAGEAEHLLDRGMEHFA